MPVLPQQLNKQRKYVGNDKGTIHYWLEWLVQGRTVGTADGEAPGVMPLPSQPTSYSCVESFPATIEHTLGRLPKREHNYPKRWDITITGRIGIEPRPYTGSAAVAPIAILDEFREFLRNYQEGATENGAVWLTSAELDSDKSYFNYNNVCLLLHATKEGDHVYVEVGTFEYDRQAASTRSSASWKLTLVGYAMQDDVAPPIGWRGFPKELPSYGRVKEGTIEAANAASREDEALWRARGMEQTNQMLTAMRIERARLASAAELRAWQQKAAAAMPGSGVPTFWCARMSKSYPWASAAGDKSRHAQVASYGLINQANTFRQCLQQGMALTSVPLTILGNLRRAIDVYYEAVKEAADTVEATSNAYAQLGTLLSTVELARTDTTTLYGMAGGSPASYSNAALPLIAPISSADVFVPGGQAAGMPMLVPAGATSWAQVAGALLGNEALSVALAKLNGAKDAYSDSKGKPLSPGDTVLVPVDGVTGAPTVEALMLVDLALDPSTGDLRSDFAAHQVGSGTDLVSVAAKGTDLALSRGYANLVQAIRYRTITRRGSIPSLPRYGLLVASIGDLLTEQVLVSTMSGTREQLRQDLRVLDVVDQTIVEQNDQLYLEFRVLPVGADEALTVVAPTSVS